MCGEARTNSRMRGSPRTACSIRQLQSNRRRVAACARGFRVQTDVAIGRGEILNSRPALPLS